MKSICHCETWWGLVSSANLGWFINVRSPRHGSRKMLEGMGSFKWRRFQITTFMLFEGRHHVLFMFFLVYPAYKANPFLLVDIRYMFVKWCMKKWMESLALANSSLSKTAQFSASSKGQVQPLPLLNFSTLIQAIPTDWLYRSVFLSAEHWQDPATWHHWLDFTSSLSIHCPGHS